MATFKLYSKQQAAAKNAKRRYRHDEIPQTLRTQILKVFDKCFGKDAMFEFTPHKSINRQTEEILKHEYGVRSLITYDTNNPLNNLGKEPVPEFFWNAPTNECLDVIQVKLTVANEVLNRDNNHYYGRAQATRLLPLKISTKAGSAFKSPTTDF
ncbi:MAG TPA: hypothetical protein VNU95_14060 [Candidatus Acidoferrales bacterium]|jgi:hypothetical protein|nr:hypothetical protein [Candidatus Acidoferrales bacterium]